MDWNVLESNQALSNLLVGGSINAVALKITKEVVQGIIVSLSRIKGSMLSNFAAMADRVVNRAVRGLLLGSVVASVGWVMGIGIASSAWVHMGALVIVTASISCQVLQVSNHYFPRQMWVCRDTTIVLVHIPLPPRYPEPPGCPCCSGERSRTESSACVWKWSIGDLMV